MDGLDIKEKILELSKEKHGLNYSGNLEIRNKSYSDVAIKVKDTYKLSLNFRKSSPIH